MLSFGLLSRMVTQWCGVERLREIGARFVAITQVHDLITGCGTVIECFERDGESLARIEVTATTQDGRQTLSGEAIMPLRSDGRLVGEECVSTCRSRGWPI